MSGGGAGGLQRLRHPAIAQVRGVLLDKRETPRIYLEMRLYAHGQLDAWVRDRAPACWQVRQADVLAALAHVHALQLPPRPTPLLHPRVFIPPGPHPASQPGSLSTPTIIFLNPCSLNVSAGNRKLEP